MATNNESRVIKIAVDTLNGLLTAERLSIELSALKENLPACDDLVHFLYHYSADEDIRQRDGEYAEIQRERLLKLIRELQPEI
jgi:hypothetical protein